MTLADSGEGEKNSWTKWLNYEDLLLNTNHFSVEDGLDGKNDWEGTKN